jgi:hypothetical protein
VEDDEGGVMRARVATFEGEVRGPEYDEQIEEIRSETESGNRPPGLEDAKGVLILSGESGKRIAITLFDDEEGMRRGDAALNEMTPVGMGTRSSVEFYEVAVLDMS